MDEAARGEEEALLEEADAVVVNSSLISEEQEGALCRWFVTNTRGSICYEADITNWANWIDGLVQTLKAGKHLTEEEKPWFNTMLKTALLWCVKNPIDLSAMVQESGAEEAAKAKFQKEVTPA